MGIELKRMFLKRHGVSKKAKKNRINCWKCKVKFGWGISKNVVLTYISLKTIELRIHHLDEMEVPKINLASHKVVKIG